MVGRRGIMRENRRKGHPGTCIKDTWTKPKGVGWRMGVGDGWGRGALWSANGDNYT